MLGALRPVLKKVSAGGVMFRLRCAVKLFSDPLFIMDGARLSAGAKAVSAGGVSVSIFDKFYIYTPSEDQPVQLSLCCVLLFIYFRLSGTDSSNAGQGLHEFRPSMTGFGCGRCDQSLRPGTLNVGCVV